MRNLLASLALLCVLLVPGASSARCRPSPGDQLVVLTPQTSQGVVLLQRRPAYSEGSVLTGDTPTTLALRRTGCSRGCASTVALRALAPNLYAFTMPGSSAAGAYEITTDAAIGRFENAPSSAPVTSLRTAPASATIDGQMVGTGMMAPVIALAAPAPPAAIGLIARWEGSSFFMPTGTDRVHFLLFPGRCRGPLPGYDPPADDATVELAFVDATGALSPTSRLTLRDVSPGAR